MELIWTLLHLLLFLPSGCSGQIPVPIENIPAPKSPPPLLLPPMPRTYCAADDPVPELLLLNCTVCSGRCGSTTDFDGEIFCSCDPGCVAYGDCCMDFERSCPVEFQRSSSLRRNFKHGRTECFTVTTLLPEELTGVGFVDATPSFIKYNFVSVCGQTGVICNRTDPDILTQPNLAIPVVDASNGVHYVNYECAKCNGVDRVIPWTPKLNCRPQDTDFYSTNETFNIDSQDKLEFYLRRCSVYYVVPEKFPARDVWCGGYGDQRKCQSDCKNTKLVDLCEKSYTIDYIEGEYGQSFDNYYCALCNGKDSWSYLQCARLINHVIGASGGAGTFSLSLLFDFNPAEGVTVGRKACPPGRRWFDSIQDCRQVSCPDDLRILDDTCAPRTLLVEAIAMVSFNFTKDTEAVLAGLQKDGLITDSLTDRLKHVLHYQDQLNVTLNTTHLPESTIRFRLGLHFLFQKNSTFNLNSDLGNFSDSALMFLEEELSLLMYRSGVNLGNVIISIGNTLSITQDLFTDCAWVQLSNDEYEIVNGSLVIKDSRDMYTRDRYRLVRSDALVCIPSSNDPTKVLLDVSEVLGVLTIILISLSIVGLAIRLILQFKITYYSSFAGRLHFNLCLSLCLAFLMILLGGATARFKVMGLCAAFGILTYLFFLAAFFWMAAVTFDTWLVFRPSASFVKVDDKDKSISKYALPCWLIPIGMAATATGIDYMDMDPRFKPEFGTNICWFNQRYALLCYFGAPVAFLTVLTTTLFIVTVVNLRKTLSSTVRSPPDKTSHQIWIYIRLFALMGVSWIFGFVAAFVGHDALWIIFIVLNASQGIMLFVSFVLHQQVLKEFRKMSRESSSSQGTSDTPLSTSDTGTRHEYKQGKPSAATSI